MRAVFALAVCFLLVQPIFPQNDRGTITGTVSDPVNAVAPGAAVKAVNRENGAVYETVTTSTGNYTIPSVQAGTYEVSVETAGFKKFVQQGIQVQVAQRQNEIRIAAHVAGADNALGNEQVQRFRAGSLMVGVHVPKPGNQELSFSTFTAGSPGDGNFGTYRRNAITLGEYRDAGSARTCFDCRLP